jgi:hypothetical protein
VPFAFKNFLEELLEENEKSFLNPFPLGARKQEDPVLGVVSHDAPRLVELSSLLLSSVLVGT